MIQSTMGTGTGGQGGREPFALEKIGRDTGRQEIPFSPYVRLDRELLGVSFCMIDHAAHKGSCREIVE